MCNTCGCGNPNVVAVDLEDRVLAVNDDQARHNREHFHEQGVLAVNLMGSPGSGKTAVLAAVARLIGGRVRLGALAGDLATDNDAHRLRAAGIPTLQITTGSACHLDAEMVHGALHRAPWGDVDYVFIENVGNLVCPAVFDLGQSANVVALSVTEGTDKPLKYPAMFAKADLVLLTKIDLLPHLEGVSLEAYLESLARVMPRLDVLPLSARSGAGIERFAAWLERLRPHRPAAPVSA